MKFALVAIIVLISILAIYMGIPSIPLFTVYWLFAIIPLILIILKKDLVNGLLLWFLLILFKEFGRIPLPMLPDISLERMIWLALFFIFFSEIALKQRKILPGDMKIEIAMFLFCMLILFSMIGVGTIYKEGHGLKLNYLLNGYAIPFSIFFLAKNIVDDEHKIRKIFIFFTIIGLYLGITGVFEHFRLDFLVFPRYIMRSAEGIHWGQARGPFVQAGVNGLVIGMIFYISLYLFIRAYKRWTKFLLIISIIFMLTTLLFTYNRASWIGFLLSSLLIPIFFPQMRKMFMVSVLAMLIVIFSLVSLEQFKTSPHSQSELAELGTKEAVAQRFTSKGSIYARINLYGVAWRMFLEKPILGFGFDTFQDVSPKYFHKIKGIPFNIKEGIAIHNTLAIILVELGLLGLSIFIFIIFYILKISIGLYRRLPPGVFLGKGLVVIFGGVFIFYFMGMLVREVHYTMFPNSIFFLLVGIIFGLNQRLQMNNSKIEEKTGVIVDKQRIT